MKRASSLLKQSKFNAATTSCKHLLKHNYSTRIRVLKSVSNDPFVNLATEDWIFNHCDPSVQHLYLWRNDKTVVIGKHQNPWKECHVQKMEEDGVNLARRRSGGGAVYQDLGNTIFTFLSPKAKYDKNINFDILINSLKNRFDIKAELSGRNDIILSEDKRKISGSAFKQGKDVCFHHGTFLVDVDMNALSRYLNPNKLKLQSKGITSVVSRVANLKELSTTLNHDSLTQQIIQEFFTYYDNKCPVEEVDLKTLRTDPSWNKYYEELKDWNWRFGQTPQFSHNFETRFEGFGLYDVYLESKNQNQITDVKIFSDSLYPMIVESFQTHLKGKQYHKQGVLDAAEQVKKDLRASVSNQDMEPLSKHVDDLAAWISNNL